MFLLDLVLDLKIIPFSNEVEHSFIASMSNFVFRFILSYFVPFVELIIFH